VVQQLCAALSELLALLLPPFLYQHDSAVLQALFCAGPANRVTLRDDNTAAAAAAASTTTSGHPGGTASTSTNTPATASGSGGLEGHAGYQTTVQPQALHVATLLAICCQRREASSGREPGHLERRASAVANNTGVELLLRIEELREAHGGVFVLRPSFSGQVPSTAAAWLVRSVVACLAALPVDQVRDAIAAFSPHNLRPTAAAAAAPSGQVPEGGNTTTGSAMPAAHTALSTLAATASAHTRSGCDVGNTVSSHPLLGSPSSPAVAAARTAGGGGGASGCDDEGATTLPAANPLTTSCDAHHPSSLLHLLCRALECRALRGPARRQLRGVLRRVWGGGGESRGTTSGGGGDDTGSAGLQRQCRLARMEHQTLVLLRVGR
jgi:hypothetical protein